MISAGYLTDKVVVLFPVYQGRDQYGTQQIKWIHSAPHWAKVKFNRGNIAQVAGEAWMSQTITVTMRYTNVVTGRCRIKWNDNTYIIDNINADKNAGAIYVQCSKLDDGSETFSE